MSSLVHHMTMLSDAASRGPKVLVSGRGVRVIDSEGKSYIDALSGLYNVNAGYGREELGAVAAEAMGKLGFGPLFFGRATEPALALADKLAEMIPASMDRIFLTLGGSDAVDSAIKLVRHVNTLAGNPQKMKIIARRDSYHGMTMGGTTATGQQALRNQVGPLLPQVLHVGQPDPDDGRVSAAELEQAILREGADTVAAFIGEPIAVPPGVAVPAADYWSEIQTVCRRHGVLLIIDEVITGFGRTGRMFASEHWGIAPDLLLMSKGLSSGYVPIGAVGMRSELVDELERSKTLLPHGFTTGGHPTCCAVALANIAILERENLVDNAAAMGAHLEQGLRDLSAAHEPATAVRALGMLTAIDVPGDVDGGPASFWIAAEMEQRGVLLRPYGPSLVIAPPLVATPQDIDAILEPLGEILSELPARGHRVLLEQAAG
jgi:putrescine aminotransferase